MTTTPTAAQAVIAAANHHTLVACLVTLVDQFRAIRAAGNPLRFSEIAELYRNDAGYSVLCEIASDLDSNTPAAVDEELRKLWAGVLASAVPVC